MIEILCDEKRNCSMDSPSDSIPDDLIRLSSSKKNIPKRRKAKRKAQVGRGKRKRVTSGTTAKRRRVKKQVKKQVKRRARKTKVKRRRR